MQLTPKMVTSNGVVDAGSPAVGPAQELLHKAYVFLISADTRVILRDLQSCANLIKLVSKHSAFGVFHVSRHVPFAYRADIPLPSLE